MMFTTIEEIHLPDHSYLDKNDECYFYGDYTPRGGYGHSDTNQLISNLKKGLDRKGRPEWVHKGKAINKCAQIIKKGFYHDWLKGATLVPVPPSKLKTDPLYDDRIVQILHRINPAKNYDIRELVIQNVSRNTMHLSDHRYRPEELKAMYSIDESLTTPEPASIGVFDDVLTSGTHFKAIKSLLHDRFPGVPVCGIFIARVVRPSADIDFTALFGDND